MKVSDSPFSLIPMTSNASNPLRIVGISAAFLSAIETGRKEPSVEFLSKCADVFEISLSALVLLSESYEKAKADGAGKAFIKKAMHSIICLLSKGCDDE